MSPATRALSARPTGEPFKKFLRYRLFELELQGPGGRETRTVGLLHGPGHNVAAVAALALDNEGLPHVLFKTGDTRASRLERGEPYVLLGYVAGRLDKPGAGAAYIGLAEVAEEVGGAVVEGSYQPLGEQLTPTMPGESTEADAYFTALVRIEGRPTGDGGGMEVPDLIGPHFMPVSAALAAMDEGQVGDGGRCRALYGRAFQAMGFIPELGVYVHDHPRLHERFEGLGLTAPRDPRTLLPGGCLPEPESCNPPDTLGSRINSMVYESREEIALPGEATMVDALTRHAIRSSAGLQPVYKPFHNQFLRLPYDRAKVALVYQDPQRGPLLRWREVERPVLAVKALALSAELGAAQETLGLQRRDVEDLCIPRDGGAPAVLAKALKVKGLEALGAPAGASCGQTDLYYHYYWAPLTRPEPDLVPLAEVLRACRQGQGDAQTEALCQRLASRLGWIPSLGMSLEAARELL